ncbi:MAG: carbohydrate kinase [Gammaproteobacteria bacterium]|nr:carbohydrate kinase [Gammaproteobacteria bacterium]MCW8928223.1 carbohydrate kinase [Gammaproteobacteria bacterium]MCW8958595.1 carbohydrate kinase [Gammaproteobacteria bacterium]MCW8972398.1 carbohydrate kinase [Gammaproteobacteria bacterium]MCW8992648.1 carbohydrate kinase [Gammaproteobacteria bacterium]
MKDSDSSSIQGRPVIFGEVLFDIFPDGREVPGGAPFNVARHLHGFGCDPLFISRIGEDARGERVRVAMQEWGMDMSGLQRDPEHPTGSVQIAMQGTSHTFDILPEQAYDFIDAGESLALLHDKTPALLYFGSLIARSPVSRATLQLLRSLSLPQFVDINLRAPWWSPEGVDGLVRGVKWLKLNDEELEQLDGSGDLGEAALAMWERYALELLIVTCGAKGAMFVDRHGITEGAPVALQHLIDTVGAGDAFSAVSILGLLRGWGHSETLERALGFAARLCEVRGAVLPDQGTYRRCLAGWQ